MSDVSKCVFCNTSATTLVTIKHPSEDRSLDLPLCHFCESGSVRRPCDADLFHLCLNMLESQRNANKMYNSTSDDKRKELNQAYHFDILDAVFDLLHFPREADSKLRQAYDMSIRTKTGSKAYLNYIMTYRNVIVEEVRKKIENAKSLCEKAS